MTQMTTGQARVVDPVLTSLAQGYADPDFIGDALFPAVPVQLRAGRILRFGREDFRGYRTRRAPGEKIKRVSVGYLSDPYSLENHALAGTVPQEIQDESKKATGIDVSKRAMYVALKANRRALEIQQANLATSAANYGASNKVTLTGTSKFSDPSSKPTVVVEAAREQIRQSIGRPPNQMVISAQAMSALRTNPEVRGVMDQNSLRVVTKELLAQLFQIPNIVVGESIQVDDADAQQDIWGNNIILAYTHVGTPDQAEPSYGYTYTLDGHPIVKQGYFDEDTQEWVVPVLYERAAVQTALQAGYLIQNVK